MYSQPPDPRSYVAPAVPRDMPSSAMMFGQPSQFQHNTAVYDYSQTAPRRHPAADVNPLLGPISTTFVDRSLAQTSSRPMMDNVQRLSGMMEQASSISQPFSFRPIASSLDSQFAVNQPAVVQPNVAASTPSQSFVQEKPPTGIQNQYPVGYGVAGPAVAQSQPDRTEVVGPDKGGGGLQKTGVDKDTLSQLLSMIGCNSNVTSLMKELIKKDEQEKTKKLESPAQQTAAPPDPSPPPPPAAVEAKPQTTENDTAKPTATAIVSQVPPEPAGVPDSTARDEESKPTLQPEPSKPGLQPVPAKESEAEKVKSTIPVLSSLSRLQNYDNPDSPEENTDKDSASAAKTGDTKSSVVKDEWERSTEEFLRSLQSKATTPAQSQKEKSRSTSRDKSVRDKPKMRTADSKKSPAQQSKTETKKAPDKRDVGNKVSAAETDSEREGLMRGKHEIESALELLQKELANLRMNKKRLLESPASAERDEELETSIANERKLTDHMSQLKNAMAELNKHLEKLSSTKVWSLVDEVSVISLFQCEFFFTGNSIH